MGKDVRVQLERPAWTLGKASIRTLTQRPGEMRLRRGSSAAIGRFARCCAVANPAAPGRTRGRFRSGSAVGRGGHLEAGGAQRAAEAPFEAAEVLARRGAQQRGLDA